MNTATTRAALKFATWGVCLAFAACAPLITATALIHSDPTLSSWSSETGQLSRRLILVYPIGMVAAMVGSCLAPIHGSRTPMRAAALSGFSWYIPWFLIAGSATFALLFQPLSQG